MIKWILKLVGFMDRILQAICRILPKPLYDLVCRFHRFLTYAFMGVLNTAVDFIMFFVMYELVGLPIEISQGIGFLCGSVNGFMLNSNLTFLEGKGRTKGQFFQYVGVDVVLVLLSSWTIGLLEDCGVPVLLNKVLVTLATGLIHYVVFKLVVFRIRKEDKAA